MCGGGYAGIVIKDVTRTEDKDVTRTEAYRRIRRAQLGGSKKHRKKSKWVVFSVES
jgi:hypothetical protein